MKSRHIYKVKSNLTKEFGKCIKLTACLNWSYQFDETFTSMVCSNLSMEPITYFETSISACPCPCNVFVIKCNKLESFFSLPSRQWNCRFKQCVTTLLWNKCFRIWFNWLETHTDICMGCLPSNWPHSFQLVTWMNFNLSPVSVWKYRDCYEMSPLLV